MELAKINKEIVIVEMDNKPEIFKALENPKLRDYPQEIKENNTIQLVSWLLVLLGVGSGKLESSIASNNFINEELGKWTYEEIKIAFKMAVVGKLNIELYQQLNPIVIGNVMKAYQEHKNKKIDKYEEARRKQLTETVEISEKEKELIAEQGVKECYEKYLEEGKAPFGYSWVYDRLKAKGILKLSNEVLYEIGKIAPQNVKRYVTEQNKPDTARLLLMSIEGSDMELNECKRLALEYYYNRL